eukprot:gene3116-21303_t
MASLALLFFSCLFGVAAAGNIWKFQMRLSYLRRRRAQEQYQRLANGEARVHVRAYGAAGNGSPYAPPEAAPPPPKYERNGVAAAGAAGAAGGNNNEELPPAYIGR